MTINETHRMWKPKMKVSSSLPVREAVVAVPLGLMSMYGITIKPTMIKLGSTTPACQGSKKTSIS
jgi:hypothetical protein